MPKSLKFLCVPVDAVGHVNSQIGIGQELLKKGYSVYFAVSNGWKGKLAPFGFIEKYYQDESKESLSLKKWGEMVESMAPAIDMPAIDKLDHFLPTIFKQVVSDAKETNSKLGQIVAEVKPDLILVEGTHIPALCNAGIPWMIVVSYNPMGITVPENCPPPLAGFSLFSENKALWTEYRKKEKEVMGPIFEDFRTWVIDHGGPELTYDGRSIWTNDSPYGNLYMYPQEMTYTMHRPDPPNWHAFDTFVRYDSEYFEVPPKLLNRSGKLVYFSMGTIGCSNLNLMRRLIEIMGKSPNRFIVSKGPFGDQLELPENMWGSNNLPQTNILPLVDLVITHGGNNTVTESFYFGKPLIVLPIFTDQMDNGRRVEETGFGLQFPPCSVTEAALLLGIETLLADQLLKRRLESISLRIKASKSQQRAAELLEKVATSKKPV